MFVKKFWKVNYSTLLIAVILALLTVLVLSPYKFNPERLFGPRTDLTQAFYANFAILRNSLQQNHRLPFWDNSILAGRPVVENPQFFSFYPPVYSLALAPSLPMGIFYLLAGHLFAFAFLSSWLVGKRLLGLGFWPQLWLGVGSLLLPKVYVYLSSGHVNSLFFLPFLPLLLFLCSKLLTSNGFFWILPTAVFLSLAFTADPRFFLLSVLGLAVFAVVRLFIRPPSLRRWCTLALRGFLVGLLLLPMVIVPLSLTIKLTALTTRAHLLASDAASGALSFFDLLRFFFPNLLLDLHQENFIYPGLLIILLSFPPVVCLRKKHNQSKTFVLPLLASILVLVFLALGTRTYAFSFLFENLWGFRFLRNPSRGFLLVDWYVVVFSSLGLATVLSWVKQHMPGVSTTKVALGILGLLVVDQLNYDWAFVFSRGPYDKSLQYQVIEQIKSESGRFRVFSPDHSLDQKLAFEAGIELVDGEDPLQLQNFVDFSSILLGLKGLPYSVSFLPSQIYQQSTVKPSKPFLSLLNVRFIVSQSPIGTDYLTLIKDFQDTFYLYEFKEYLPRAYLSFNWDVSDDPLSGLAHQDNPLSLEKVVYLDAQQVSELGLETNYLGRQLEDLKEHQSVEIIEYKPDQISLEVCNESDAVLVLSEIDYPGWEVFVDGQKVLLISADSVFRSLYLESGEHRVEFSYRPLSFSSLESLVGRLLSCPKE